MSIPPDEPPPFKMRHTNVQRVVLAINIVVVISCLVGAGALVYAKQQLDARLQTSAVRVSTSGADGQNPSAAPGDSG